jgi:aspartate/methionine/tyrosine aminotransferase
MIRLPRHLDEIKPFQAVQVYQAAKRLEAEGRSIVHLEFGEPDFPTPAVIQEAAVAAMRAGHTRYTHSMGIPELRETICAWYRRKYGVAVAPDQVLVSMGTSVLLQLVMLLLLEPGDEVILADPSYACYSSLVLIARGVPVRVPVRESDGFQLDPAAVKRAITPRTRALIVCSPANPTGVALRDEVWRELARLEVPLISDEIYHGLTYGGAEHSALEFTRGGFVLNGFSKYFAMTGWRLGYLIFPPEVLPHLMKLHQNVMISPADFPQHAGIAAMTKAVPDCERYRAEYDRRRVFMMRRLADIGLPLRYEPVGAFYCFANARHLGGDSMALALDILEKAGVAVAPGIDFGPGGEGYLRFSYANSMENIAVAMERLADYCAGRAER